MSTVGTPMPKAGGIYVSDVFDKTTAVTYIYERGTDDGDNRITFEKRKVMLEDIGVDVTDLAALGHWALGYGTDVENMGIFRNVSKNTAAVVRFKEPGSENPWRVSKQGGEGT